MKRIATIYKRSTEVVNRRSKIIKAYILALETVTAGLWKTLLLVTYSRPTAAIQSRNCVAGVELGYGFQ